MKYKRLPLYVLYLFICVACISQEESSLFVPTLHATPTGIAEFGSVQPSMRGENTAKEDDWITYQEPQGHFRVQIPVTWSVQPPGNLEGGAYAALVWQFVEDTSDQPRKITIGRATSPIETEESLEEWSMRNDGAELEQVSRQLTNWTHQGLDALSVVEGLAPQGVVEYTNLRCRNRVWFLWTMSASEQDATLSAIYDRFVESIELNCGLPQ